MHSFLGKFASVVSGVLCGFDRLSLCGNLRRVSYQLGLQYYLWAHRILFKDFAAHSEQVTARLEEASLRHAQQQGRDAITYDDIDAAVKIDFKPLPEPVRRLQKPAKRPGLVPPVHERMSNFPAERNGGERHGFADQRGRQSTPVAALVLVPRASGSLRAYFAWHGHRRGNNRE